MLTVPNEWKDALVNDALQAAQDQTPTSAPCCHFAVQQASQRQAANASMPSSFASEALVIWGHTEVLRLHTSINTNPYLSKALAASLAHDLL